ncbi:MAG: hypothetical protein A2136_06345 [Chloroflexi bacterium RBG_16_54_11]|nr:MAG: hypothetical protein A2136_06345 [Chloroflexi bacterium RBG_16_54_11]
MNNKLLPSLKKLFAVKQPNEEEIKRLGHLFNLLMVISVGIVVTLVIAFVLMKSIGLGSPFITAIATVFPGIFIPLSVFCMILSRRKHLKLGINLYVWCNFIVIGLAAYTFDGLTSPAWSLYIWTITIAGTLLAPVYALGMTGGVLVYFLILTILSIKGYYSPPLTFGVRGREYVEVVNLMTMLTSTVGLLTYLNMRSLHQTLTILHDEITEHRRAEDALRASENKYRTLVETSPNGITLTSPEGILLFCNQQAARLYGYESPAIMQGLRADQLIVPEERDLVVQNNQRLLEEGNIKNTEYSMLRQDGSSFPAEVNASIIRDNEGKPVSIITITQDITERKQAREEEKRLIKLKEEFISSVSHDLRSPLFSLMGYLDLLRKGKVVVARTQKEFLTRAAEDGNRLLDMVNELLDISRLEAGHLTLNWEKVDLGLVIENVIKSFTEQANAWQIPLVTTSTVPSLIAEVDPARIRRVLSNLVENALKFSKAGESISVTGELDHGNICIRVSDHGCGISLEDCGKIFDKFYQVDKNKKINASGTGLGLYISRQLIEAHGGTISVNSQEGVGSTFTVTIPVERRK